MKICVICLGDKIIGAANNIVVSHVHLEQK